MHERRLTKGERAFVEEKLHNFKANEALVKELQEEQKELAGAIRGASMDKARAANYQVGDPTASTAIKIYTIDEEIQRIGFWQRAIKDTYSIISPEDKELVRLVYFENTPIYPTIDQLGISESEYYRRKRNVLPIFARRMCIL